MGGAVVVDQSFVQLSQRQSLNVARIGRHRPQEYILDDVQNM
jgi:hypothetical protein